MTTEIGHDYFLEQDRNNLEVLNHNIALLQNTVHTSNPDATPDEAGGVFALCGEYVHSSELQYDPRPEEGYFIITCLECMIAERKFYADRVRKHERAELVKKMGMIRSRMDKSWLKFGGRSLKETYAALEQQLAKMDAECPPEEYHPRA